MRLESGAAMSVVQATAAAGIQPLTWEPAGVAIKTNFFFETNFKKLMTRIRDHYAEPILSVGWLQL